MTREEAKEELLIAKEDWWEDDGYGHPTESFYKMQAAFDMAISDMERVEELEELANKLRDEFLKSCHITDDALNKIETLEAENKRLKDCLKTIKDTCLVSPSVVFPSDILDTINEYLGEEDKK